MYFLFLKNKFMFTKNVKKIGFCVFALALALNCFNCNKAFAMSTTDDTKTITMNQTHEECKAEVTKLHNEKKKFCDAVTANTTDAMIRGHETIIGYCSNPSN